MVAAWEANRMSQMEEQLAAIPEGLRETLELFHSIPDRSERIEALISMGERFHPVPERIATRPFPEENRVQGCESEAYVWAEPREDGTLNFYFAVENPQGISAMALAVILQDNCSGAPLEQVRAIPRDIVYRFFGRELSMGKSLGLMGMIDSVRRLAAKSGVD